MNPQPHPFVGQLGVLIFSLLVAYFCFTGNKKRATTFNDNFTIGYIYDNIPVVETVQTNYVKPVQNHTTKKTPRKIKPIPSSLVTPIQNAKTKEKDKPAIIEENVFDETLFNDCVLALMSLGTKKSQSKNIAKQVFEEHNPKTIEEFIRFVYLKS